MGEPSSATKSAVGDELAAVLPAGPWYKRAHLRKLNYCIISLVLFSSSNGYDGSLMNSLQSLKQWNEFMNKPSGAWLGFINSVYWLACGINFPLAAWASNNYGRKSGVYLGYILLALGSILQTVAQHQSHFIVARFFIGCASAWLVTCAPLLINEIAYPSQRGIVSALFMCGFYVGGALSAWITFAVRNMPSSWAWRIPSLLQMLLPLIALPGFMLAPQSPRWLISAGRIVEARDILVKWHGGGDDDSRLVAYEVVEIATTIRLEKEAHASSGYLEMIKTPGNRKRLFISVSLGVFAQWVGNGVVSYYLALVLDTVGITSVTDQTMISAFLQIWNLIWAIAAAFSVDRVGRRPLLLMSATIMTISYIIVTGLSGSFAQSHHGATGVAVIPFLFIFFAGYDIALTPLLCAYPCEIWPYRLRSRGLVVTWVSTIVAIFFNTFVNPIALETIGWKYYIVFIVVLVVFGFTAFFYYPETKGHSLEQMAVIFDGNDAEVSNPVTTIRSVTSASTVEVLDKNDPVVLLRETVSKDNV